LNDGDNSYQITVVAVNGTQKVYNVTVHKALATDKVDASLRSLTVSQDLGLDGTRTFRLTPSFDKDSLTYRVTVPTSVTAVDIEAFATDVDATLLGNLGHITLPSAGNTFEATIYVTAQDKATKLTYKVFIYRAQASESVARLQSLTLSEGTLTPAFNSVIFTYTASVFYVVDNITIAATANAGASVTGTVTNAALQQGDNLFTITVTAEDGTTTQDYVVTITRRPPANPGLSNLTVSQGNLVPAFSPTTVYYDLDLPCDVDNVSVLEALVDPLQLDVFFRVDNEPETTTKPTITFTGPAAKTLIIRVVTKGSAETVIYTLTVRRPFGSDILLRYFGDVLAVNLNTSSNGGYNFVGFQWQENKVDISGGKSYYYMNTTTYKDENAVDPYGVSHYRVILTTSDGTVLPTCSLAPMSGDYGHVQMKAFPNPAYEEITLENEAWQEAKTIDLCTTNGIVLKSFTVTGYQTRINLGKHPQGIYLLRTGKHALPIIIK
jgi:hypothetical protein